MIYTLSKPQISRNCKLEPTKISYQNQDPASWNQLIKVQQIIWSNGWENLLVDYKLLVSKQSDPLMHLYRSGKGGAFNSYYLSSIRARGLKKNLQVPCLIMNFQKSNFVFKIQIVCHTATIVSKYLRENFAKENMSGSLIRSFRHLNINSSSIRWKWVKKT